MKFQTKLELAAELVEEIQQQQRVRARWRACDEGYGQDPALLERVAATGLWYLAEVPGLTHVWPQQDPAPGLACPSPQLWVPPTPSGRRGRAFTKTRLHPDSPRPVRLDTLPSQFPDRAWQRYRILEGSKGPLIADFAVRRAVTTRQGMPGPEVWVLVRRAVGEAGAEGEVKLYLSTAPADTPLVELVRVSGMRWPIESCFEEAKSEVGLDHYELRSWRGWHHHMTLVLLAHHFLVRQQQRLNQRGGPVGLPAHQQAPVCLDDPTAEQVLLPAAVVLSVAQVRLLLQAVLPLPLRDIAATLELVRSQQQCKAAAYYSHRKRILRQLNLVHPP